MLSYQHAYHAGNRADIHKHDLLARTLDILVRKDRPVSYIETHAGRGVYNLKSAEAAKTGEAGEGWLGLSQGERDGLAPSYTGAVQALNGGKLSPLYPGSPMIAAHILRTHDSLHLMELHPQEHAALEKAFAADRRVRIHKRDGLEGALALAPPQPRRGLILVDPSYELKEEYETVPDFAVKLARKWPEGAVLIWIPVLPAGRHEGMVRKLKGAFASLELFRVDWKAKGEGMSGSIMAGINLPYGL